MSLGMRKLIVIGLVAGVSLLANLWLVASWLEEHGVIDWARYVRSEYFTGTAITITIVLLILLVRPGVDRPSYLRRCPVCDHVLLGCGQYCSACGSKAC